VRIELRDVGAARERRRPALGDAQQRGAVASRRRVSRRRQRPRSRRGESAIGQGTKASVSAASDGAASSTTARPASFTARPTRSWLRLVSRSRGSRVTAVPPEGAVHRRQVLQHAPVRLDGAAVARPERPPRRAPRVAHDGAVARLAVAEPIPRHVVERVALDEPPVARARVAVAPVGHRGERLRRELRRRRQAPGQRRGARRRRLPLGARRVGQPGERLRPPEVRERVVGVARRGLGEGARRARELPPGERVEAAVVRAPRLPRAGGQRPGHRLTAARAAEEERVGQLAEGTPHVGERRPHRDTVLAARGVGRADVVERGAHRHATARLGARRAPHAPPHELPGAQVACDGERLGQLARRGDVAPRQRVVHPRRAHHRQVGPPRERVEQQLLGVAAVERRVGVGLRRGERVALRRALAHPLVAEREDDDARRIERRRAVGPRTPDQRQRREHGEHHGRRAGDRAGASAGAAPAWGAAAERLEAGRERRAQHRRVGVAARRVGVHGAREHLVELPAHGARHARRSVGGEARRRRGEPPPHRLALRGQVAVRHAPGEHLVQGRRRAPTGRSGRPRRARR
jgi:hypothetical protein